LIGERVREARIAQKPEITQADLSARLAMLNVQIDRAGISKIECKSRVVTDFELVAIAKCLHVSPGWLLGTEPKSAKSK
jgi:HTH-type transcriptional regulator, cell division transcriptional repressor